MTDSETWRLLYSNFYAPKSPRFAYAVATGEDACTKARSGSCCVDNTRNLCYKIGAGAFECEKGNADCNGLKERSKGKLGNTGDRGIKGPQNYLTGTTGSRFDPNKPPGAMPTGLMPLEGGGGGGAGGGGKCDFLGPLKGICDIGGDNGKYLLIGGVGLVAIILLWKVF